MSGSRVLKVAYVVVVGLVLAVFVGRVIQAAWLSDDAYITFRSIHMLAADQGAVFNAGERVQVFTHPLWYGLLTSAFFFTHELYTTSLVLSIAISALVALLFVVHSKGSPTVQIVGLLVLALSTAFIDYSTSGLENPLGHLVVIGAVVGLGALASKRDRLRLVFVGAAAALAYLTRPDLVLLMVPLLLLVWWQSSDRLSGVRYIAIGLIPAALWTFFSFWYYGFPFPNSAYAKLTTGLPRSDLILQGIRYLLDTLVHDPVTLVIIAAGASLSSHREKPQRLALAAGLFLYLGYIVWIGGDFMRGRFLSVPFLLAVVLLSEVDGIMAKNWRRAAAVGLLILGAVFAGPRIAAGGEYGETYPIDHMGKWGIADERAAYYPYTGLMRSNQVLEAGAHPAALEGARASREGKDVAVPRTLGFFGFYAGRGVHVIDRPGLADPLLARLTPKLEDEWRIGHLDREIPAGYLETLTAGENKLEDPDLARYYQKLALIIQGPVWSVERLKEALLFNVGSYNHYLEAYEQESR